MSGREGGPPFRLTGALRRDHAVATWFAAGDDELRRLARIWFERVRNCGDDVCELIHDGRPTACVEGAAFSYVAAHQAHVTVGFFHGAALDDPAGLLQGAGKRMRHVKLPWGAPVDEAALRALVEAAYRDVRHRLADA